MADDGGEKSEEPTSRQLDKAREEGNVAKSRELTSGILLFTSALFLLFYFPYFLDGCERIYEEFFQFAKFKLDNEGAIYLFYIALTMVAKIALPPMIFFFIISLLAEVLQAGFHVSAKAIEPKWEKLNFFTALPKFLAPKRKLVELAKSLFKVLVLGWLAYSIIMGHIDEIIRMSDAEFMDSSVFTGKLLFELLFKIALVVLVLGIMDYAYMKWQHRQDLMMTKQQVKEEYKQMEGDPLVKQRIRSAQRELARKRMMEDVPSSDVVITNPTHYAVALKYDMNGNRAPLVVAKGQRLMALRIREIARENNVEIVENPPLARALYSGSDIGDEIPENLYKAVAEILAAILSKKR